MIDDDKKVVDPTTSMLSEFAKLIQEGKKAKEEAEAKKKQTFFEKYKIENTELNPFSFISELAKLKHEAETPEEEVIEQPEMVVEEVLPEQVVEVKKQSASQLLAELASLIQQGKSANKEVFEEQEEHLEPFVAEMVQEIVELQQEEIKEEVIEEPKPLDLISQTVESITKVAEQNKVNEVTNLFSTPEPEKTSPNFKAIQSKLKSLEQWVSKISAAGAGSGSYWLNDLGDTDKTSLQNATDGQVLTFSADIGKWTAQDGGASGGTVDTVARTTANKASANTITTQGVDDTQNTRIGSVETSIINQNNSIINLQNVNLTQNTNIATVTGIAQAAFDKANTPQSQLVNGADTLSLNGANKIDLPGGTAYIFSATNNITLSPDGSGDNNLEIINNVGATLKTDRSFEIRTNSGGTNRVWSFTQGGSLFFPDSTYQLTAFTGVAVDQSSRDAANAATTLAQSAYNYANTIVSDTQIDPVARTTANNASSNTIAIQGIDATQNTRLNALEAVNTNQNTSIGIIQGVDLTQNTNITAADVKAQAAFDKANTAITTSGGTITGRLNVAYTPATVTGYALTLSAANTQGGTGYADFLKITNTSSGATSPNKSFRLTSGGGIEIVNSAYTATILGLSDTGDFSVSGKISVNGAQAVNGPAFSAYAAAILQTIPNNVQTKVLFQTEEYDTNGCYASSRFTPNVAGYYQLNAEVRIDGTSGTGEMMIILYKNGSEYKRGTNQSGTQIASNFWAMQVSSLVYANGTGDYFEIYVQQGSGGDRTVTAVNNSAITWFNGCMMRGA